MHLGMHLHCLKATALSTTYSHNILLRSGKGRDCEHIHTGMRLVDVKYQPVSFICAVYLQQHNQNPVCKQPWQLGVEVYTLQRLYMKQYPFTGISCLSQVQAQRDLQNHYIHTVIEQLLHCCMDNMLCKVESFLLLYSFVVFFFLRGRI